MLDRQGLLSRWAAVLLALSTLACAAPCLEEANDLKALADDARAHKLAILIEFSVADCEYCEFVENDVLKPMLKSGDYRQKVLIRRLRFDTGASLKNFSGAQVKVREFAQRYGVRLAPTLVLLDAQGQPLSAPLVGVGSRDWYAMKLDAAIEEAGARIHSVR
jgi:thioredoxin-related protein